MDVAKFVFGNVGRGVVAAAFCFPVTREVLGAGSDRTRCCKVVSLESFHHGDGQAAGKIRVFSGALRDPAPARIAGDVDHRREGPVDARLRRLERRDTGTLPDDLRVPGRGLAERYRHHGLEAVNHVAADEQRNTEPALLDRDTL